MITKRFLSHIRQFFLVYRYPLLAFLSSRITLLLVVYLGLAMVPLAIGDGRWRGFEDNLLLDGFSRWDSGWYWRIAEEGYSNIPIIKGQRDTAFFPAYPLLLSLAGALGRSGIQAWGIVISNILFGCGLCFLFDLTKKHFDGRIARLTVALAAYSPYSIFFSSVYTESLFFCLTTVSFWLSMRGRAYPAMLAASVASVTRVVGILCVPFSLINYFSSPPAGIQAHGRRRKEIAFLLPAALVGISLLIVHLVYLQLTFGDALQFVNSQKGWAKESGVAKLLAAWAPLLSLDHLAKGQFYVMGVINSSILAAAIGLNVHCIRRQWLPPSISVWSLLTLMASSTLWFSGGRFALALFPLYMMLAVCLRRLPAELSVGSSALLMSLFSFLFAHWYWVA